MDDVNWDFLNFLHPDVACRILICLDDVGDIIRASSVSRAWRDFIIGNGICRRLCLTRFPPLSVFERKLDVSIIPEESSSEVGDSGCTEVQKLKKEHRVFSSLAAQLSSIEPTECIWKTLRASSTNNDPEEDISNTLVPLVDGDDFPYWLSEGSNDPEHYMYLTYELISDFCVVTEIQIQPFQASFEENSPIYSAKAVRFFMGNLESVLEFEEVDTKEGRRLTCTSGYQYYDWNYISKEFPMAQENRLQRFKLPEPVLCIGGLLQIELLGRVQKRQADGKFYLGASYVQAVGQPLTPVFFAEILERITLKFNPEACRKK